MGKPKSQAGSTSPSGYELKKVSFIKGGGLKATFVETLINDDVVNKIETVKTIPIPKHPDLERALTPLKTHLARIYGYLDIPKEGDEKVTNTITITGVSFSGDEDGETEGIVISANKTVLGGERVVALNTPNIVLGTDTYSHSKDLAGHLKEVRKEVDAYLFEQKYSQLSLFNTNLKDAKKENDSPKEEEKKMKVA